jgi:putative transposase
MVVIDQKSRFVLNCSVSNTMDDERCAEMLRETVSMHGAPEIQNTDQGSQFTSDVFTKHQGRYRKGEIRAFNVRKGRAIDNVFIEQLWRCVKYKYIYYRPPVDGLELNQVLKEWFTDYNTDQRYIAMNDVALMNIYDLQKQDTQNH